MLTDARRDNRLNALSRCRHPFEMPPTRHADARVIHCRRGADDDVTHDEGRADVVRPDAATMLRYQDYFVSAILSEPNQRCADVIRNRSSN